LVADTFDIVGSASAENAVYGIDVANARCIIYEGGANGYVIWSMVDGVPGARLSSALLPTTRGDHKFIADSSGAFWSIAQQKFIKFEIGGVTEFSAGADWAHDGCFKCDYDTTRNRFYYWSATGLGTEYLKTLDCATGAEARISAAVSTTGTNPINQSMRYAEDIDALLLINTGNSPATVWVLEPTDGTERTTYAIALNPTKGGFDYQSSIIWSYAPGGWDPPNTVQGVSEFIFSALTLACPTVPSVQSGVFVRSGLATSQFDVTGLSGITRTVCSFPWSQISAGRVPSALLAGTYFYQFVMSGSKIKGVERGGAELATIPYEDLGAHMVGDSGDDPLPLRMVNDLEMPAQQGIAFINLAANYNPGHELSDRMISATPVTVQPLDVAIGMQPDEAKGVINTALRDRASALLTTRISLLRSDYPTIEPTDAVIVTGADGSQYRMRVEQMVDRFPLVELDLVLDDPSVLDAQGITSTAYESQTTVVAPANTIMRLADLPLLQDSDNSAGSYVFTKGDRTPYPGAAIIVSDDNVNYVPAAIVSESAVFGSCTTTLGDWTGPRVMDNLNSVTVNVGDGILTSSTRALVLGSQTVNAYAIGSDATGYEVGQFIEAELISSSPNIYTLRRFMRGSKGTEWRMVDHVAGEKFMLLRAAGMRRIALTNAQLGANRYYKGVTIGRADSSATAQQFTASGVSLKPLSPARVRVTRDASNNATIDWSRRTRMATRFTGPLGVSVPLGEQTEAYQIDFYTSDAYTTLATSKPSTSESMAFSAAEQTAAGLTPGDYLHMDIKMRSATVGLGYALRRSA
jgi:hypothetical protein